MATTTTFAPKRSGKCALCHKVPGPHNFQLPPAKSACNNHDVNVCKKCWAEYLKVEIEDQEDTFGDIQCVECKAALTYSDIKLRATKESFEQYVSRVMIL
jgi:hypothetical protein